MIKWTENLHQIATKEENKKTLNHVLEAYLTSPYANCQKKRTDAVLLFKHLKLLFNNTPGVH